MKRQRKFFYCCWENERKSTYVVVIQAFHSSSSRGVGHDTNRKACVHNSSPATKKQELIFRWRWRCHNLRSTIHVSAIKRSFSLSSSCSAWHAKVISGNYNDFKERKSMKISIKDCTYCTSSRPTQSQFHYEVAASTTLCILALSSHEVCAEEWKKWLKHENVLLVFPCSALCV